MRNHGVDDGVLPYCLQRKRGCVRQRKIGCERGIDLRESQSVCERGRVRGREREGEGGIRREREGEGGRGWDTEGEGGRGGQREGEGGREERPRRE